MAFGHIPISLALQGGGSHGAFTWGVLERLLEEEGLRIDAISGASAGAMNAVLLAHGLTTGGRVGAVASLRAFWEGIAGAQALAVAQEAAATDDDGALGAAAPGLRAMLFLTRFFSPYQLNPFGLNPLRDRLTELVDFERLRRECRVELFLAATRVASGALRVFNTREISLDSVMASACLPTLHHSVEIDGEAYWDGGLAANPPLLPLLGAGRAPDIVLVLLQPGPRVGVPTSAEEISQRLAQIGFGAAFQAEVRCLERLMAEAQRSWLGLDPLTRRLRRLRVHQIDDPAFMGRLDVMSQANTQAALIAALHAAGRARAGQWLDEHRQALGRHTTAQLARLLQ
ncbi:MAG: patatin-like phospholipase family protein [Pseudomonadota bacterium]|nr:patatin-like phospholipase family protein [Pseudomonadota bacterium]